MNRFAVTLPGVSARERDDAAAKLAVTSYLQFGQRERVDALLFRVTAADVRVPDRARDVVEELIAGLRAPGVVEAGTAGLTREDECRVSLVLRTARNAAAGVTPDAPPHVAEILEGLRRAWDQRHRGVPSSDQDLAEVLGVAAAVRSKGRSKELARAREVSAREKEKRKKDLEAALAARLAARVGLVGEETRKAAVNG